MNANTPATPPTSFAAAAPQEPQSAPEDDALDIQSGDDQMHEIFEKWSAWRRSRTQFVPANLKGPGDNILGKLRGASRPWREPPEIALDPFMQALNRAIVGQPKHALDTQVFLAYYGHRITHIKANAAILGISRQHFYRLLRAFGTRVIAAAHAIEAEEGAMGRALPHRVDSLED